MQTFLLCVLLIILFLLAYAAFLFLALWVSYIIVHPKFNRKDFRSYCLSRLDDIATGTDPSPIGQIPFSKPDY